MKKKLNLGELKVKSFVTDLKSGVVNTVKGRGPGGRPEVATDVTEPQFCLNPDSIMCTPTCGATHPYNCGSSEANTCQTNGDDCYTAGFACH